MKQRGQYWFKCNNPPTTLWRFHFPRYQCLSGPSEIQTKNYTDISFYSCLRLLSLQIRILIVFSPSENLLQILQSIYFTQIWKPDVLLYLYFDGRYSDQLYCLVVTVQLHVTFTELNHSYIHRIQNISRQFSYFWKILLLHRLDSSM